jgi:hypothetical protein
MPRPCLKPPHPNPGSSPPSSHKVHFPPSPSIASTYATHSSSVYDRAPIAVSPNVCALPERGDRTYPTTISPILPPQPPPPLWTTPPPPCIIHDLDTSSSSESSDGVKLPPSITAITTSATAGAYFTLPTCQARARAENSAHTSLGTGTIKPKCKPSRIKSSAATAILPSSSPSSPADSAILMSAVVSDDGCLGGF